MNARYRLTTLTPEGLLAAAGDFETYPLPDVVVVNGTLPATAVRWRDAVYAPAFRDAAARRLLSRWAPSVDRAADAGLWELPIAQRKHMVRLLRDRPDGALKLLIELEMGGMSLRGFLALALPRGDEAPGQTLRERYRQQRRAHGPEDEEDWRNRIWG